MDVKSLLVRFGTDTKAMEAGFKKADKFVEKHAEKFKKAGRTMTIAGGAILGVVGGVVKAYADFDDKLTQSTAIMGDVSDAMRNKMAQAAKEMSEKSTFAAKDLAESYYFLASAGLNAEQSIAALPVVCAFAQAGAFDLATATDLLTDAQSTLGLSSKDVVKNQENMITVSDALVTGATLANASVSQFSEALTSKAGPSMRGYGVALNEGVAVLAAFADQGIKGKLAGEKYSIVLRDLQKAALGNKKAFKKAGVAVYDANMNLNNMGDIVAQLENHMGDMTAGQKKAALGMMGFQEESQSVILTLMGTSEKIKEYELALDNAGGTTKRVADKQLKSLTSQLTMAKNTAMNAAISLGESLAPIIVKLAKQVKDTVGEIRRWVEENPKLVKGILEVGLKAGVLLTLTGPLIIALPKVAAGIRAVHKASVLAKAGLGGLALGLAAGYGSYKLLIEVRDALEKRKGTFVDDETTAWAKLNKELGGFSSFAEKVDHSLNILGETLTVQGEKVDSLTDVWDHYGQNSSEALKAISEGKHGKGAQKVLEDLGGVHFEVAVAAATLTAEIEKADRADSIYYQTLRDQKKAQDEAAEAARKAREELERLGKGLTDVKEVGDELGNRTLVWTGWWIDFFKAVKEYRDQFLTDEQAALNALDKYYGTDRENAIEAERQKFKAKKKYITETYGASTEANTLLELEKERHGQAEFAIDEEYDEKEKALAKETSDAKITIEEEEAEKRKAMLAAGFECANAFINGLDAAFAQAYENQMIRIDNEEKATLAAIDNKYDATIEGNKKILEAEEEKTEEILQGIEDDYEAKKKWINDNVKDEEKRAEMLADLATKYQEDLEAARTEREEAEQIAADNLEDIEEAKNEALRIASEDLEIKRSDARRKAAKQEKAVALLSAIVNTAAGVTKALSSTIPPFNIILAAITAAAGAVQIALIASKPIPLAEGGIVTQPTTALIGEAGPEAVIPLNKLQPALAGDLGGFRQFNYFYGDINNAGDLDEISRRLAERTRRALEQG